jgi:hypothetical protein
MADRVLPLPNTNFGQADKGPKRGAGVLHFARKPAIDQDFSIDVFDGKARRCFDAFDLAARR